MVTVLHRTEKSDMPKDHFQAFTSDPLIDQWYNVQSTLKINQKLEHEILKVTDDLSEVIAYTVNNHLTYAKNCGEGYLPIMGLNEDTFSFWFPQTNFTQEEDQILGSIRDKIGPNINIVRTNLIIARIVNDADITKSIHEDTVTNVWMKTST